MMHSKYLEDVFDERMFRYVDSVRQSETDNFGELVDLVKLDLTKDFMGIDLSGVDFSNTDLRGYNFSGSNLSNTFGTNIIIDNTTNLSGASINDSIIEILYNDYINLDRLDVRAQYERICSYSWGEQCLWVEKNSKRELKDDINKHIMTGIFKKTKEQSVKTHVMLFAKRIYNKENEYRNFILSIFADGNLSDADKSAALYGILVYLGNDELAYKTLFLSLDSLSPSLLSKAYIAIIKSKYFSKNKMDIFKKISKMESRQYREKFIEIYSSSRGDIYNYIYGSKNASGIKDFGEDFTGIEVEGIVKKYVRENIVRNIFNEKWKFIRRVDRYIAAAEEEERAISARVSAAVSLRVSENVIRIIRENSVLGLGKFVS